MTAFFIIFVLVVAIAALIHGIILGVEASVTIGSVLFFIGIAWAAYKLSRNHKDR